LFWVLVLAWILVLKQEKKGHNSGPHNLVQSTHLRVWGVALSLIGATITVLVNICIAAHANKLRFHGQGLQFCVLKLYLRKDALSKITLVTPPLIYIGE
jgi:hypothetical protein